MIDEEFLAWRLITVASSCKYLQSLRTNLRLIIDVAGNHEKIVPITSIGKLLTTATTAPPPTATRAPPPPPSPPPPTATTAPPPPPSPPPPTATTAPPKNYSLNL